MDVKIVLVAEWDGWCGRCAAERPLVLTRTGRRTLRSLLTGTGDGQRPLTMTCRLCGVGALVPREEDDPEIVLEPDEVDQLTASAAAPSAIATTPGDLPAASGSTSDVDQTAGHLVVERTDAGQHEELKAARQALGGALQALLAQRVGQAGPALLHRATLGASFAAPVLPQQRSQELAAPVDGLAALQLLADGLDLLSPSQH